MCRLLAVAMIFCMLVTMLPMACLSGFAEENYPQDDTSGYDYVDEADAGERYDNEASDESDGGQGSDEGYVADDEGESAGQGPDDASAYEEPEDFAGETGDGGQDSDEGYVAGDEGEGEGQGPDDASAYEEPEDFTGETGDGGQDSDEGYVAEDEGESEGQSPDDASEYDEPEAPIEEGDGGQGNETDQEIMDKVFSGDTVSASDCAHRHRVASGRTVEGWAAYDDEYHGRTGMIFYSERGAEYCLDCGGTILNGQIADPIVEGFEGWEHGDMDTDGMRPHTFDGNGLCTVCGYKKGSKPGNDDTARYADDSNNDEDYDVDFSMVYPNDGSKVNPYKSIDIRWSDVTYLEVLSWNVEIYRDGEPFDTATVFEPCFPTIEAKFVTPGSKFDVYILPILQESGNVEKRHFKFTVADEKKPASPHSSSSHADEDELIGAWRMTEARKNDHDDVIQFNINIHSVDAKGSVDLEWGSSGRIEGKWDAEKKALTVHHGQVYILSDGMLAGANEKYSGIAFKADADQNFINGSILGRWRMTEYRKNDNNDIIQFDIYIHSVDSDGNVDLDWGGSGRIKGKWDKSKQTLTVHHKQVYVLHNDVLGGGNEKYSGIAIRQQ